MWDDVTAPARTFGFVVGTTAAETKARRGSWTVNDHPHLASIDESAVRTDRAERIRRELRLRDREVVLVVDPINLRYATGTRNMQVWTMHDIVRYALVFAHGPTVLFDLANRYADLVHGYGARASGQAMMPSLGARCAQSCPKARLGALAGANAVTGIRRGPICSTCDA